MSRPSPRIVVADDDDDVRMVVVTKLERRGYEVRTTGDGDAALDLIREWAPDLAVLDITMPTMSGLDVLRAVRRDPEVSETRIVMLTGHARGAERTVGLDAGADEYVLKPFSPGHLCDVVDDVLER